jgi:hypothetical protein
VNTGVVVEVSSPVAMSRVREIWREELVLKFAASNILTIQSQSLWGAGEELFQSLMMRVLTLVVLFGSVACFADKNADLVTSLPGLSWKPLFNVYSGYLQINATTGKNFFYILVEAANASNTKPLIRWLNGGPGRWFVNQYLL